MSPLPTPLGSALPDLRSAQRRRADRPLADAQTARMGGGVSVQRVGPRLPERMIERRSGQLESVFTDDSQSASALVVTGELLVRRPSTDDATAALTRTLAEQGYVERSIDSPELALRLLRYSSPGRRVSDRTGDVRELRRQDQSSGLLLVPVLQHIDAGALSAGSVTVVIKSPEDRSPTEVLPVQMVGEPVDSPVVIAVIDTGIAQEVRTDGMLAELDRATAKVDPLDAFPAEPTPPGDGFLDLGAGHGTFVAGVVRQVDPRVQIRMYRAVDSDGVGTELEIAAAMIQAVKDGAHIVNLSLGTHSLDNEPPLAFEAALDAIDELAADGESPVIVASAGNAGTSREIWPAASQRVVAVAALTPEGEGAPWSSRGSWVDCSAIGQGVVSTYVQGTEEPEFGGDVYGPNAWAMWSGTSFTAPQVSGAIAALCRQQDLTPRSALDRLLVEGQQLGDFGRAMEILPGT